MIPNVKLWDGEKVRDDIVNIRFDKMSVMVYPNILFYPDTDKDSSELMWGIGINDVNENEIFSGHVVRWEDEDGEHFGLVEFDNDNYVAGFIIVLPDRNIREIFFGVKIVGNKWENPELVFE